MPPTVDLPCACGRTFTAPKARGQYPARCPRCRDAPRLRRLAEQAGLTAVYVNRGGNRVAAVIVPWYDEPATFDDGFDLDWILSELSYENAKAPAWAS